jgi:hypothetical protein
MMSFLKSDLLRYFAVGFVAGAIALFATVGVGPERVTADNVVPAAIAAPAQ